jgi:HD-like signal output (HDOD) protein
MNDRSRILFVDDEPSVLDGLRDLLRKDRGRWDMVFAASGEAGLAELLKEPFHIVVSDMRMPGMDGVQFLSQVKSSHPSAARIILTGHAERDDLMRALAVAQRFLSKPCDAATLRSALERTHDLQGILGSAAVRAVVGDLERLPSVPRTYMELTEAASDPEKGVADLAAIVLRDPAMSVKVLQIVNSAYFGLAQHMTSIQQAVVYLGSELLKGLALSASVFGAHDMRPIDGFSIERLQNDSVLSARIAKRFLGGAKVAEEAFTAALVRDIGKIVIALGLPARLADVLREARASGRPEHVVEKELLGASHAEIGAYLLGVWGLPFSIVESVAYHHTPGQVSDGPCEILAAVHAAEALLTASRALESDPAREAALDTAFLERAGVAAELPRWRAIADEEIRRATGKA